MLADVGVEDLMEEEWDAPQNPASWEHGGLDQ